MPCFKGLAVSIHTPDGPLPEHSIQRQSRASRITSYIPVPPPKIPDTAGGKPEQSTFAISITLLNPGQDVPYSVPKPTPDNPTPKPKVVGGLPAQTEQRGLYSSSVPPYQALTNSPNETVAAYIYFDGRQKEEVATLLRRGEETWVNSRWVSVPESEGGGLAEREFLFREVGLERWLNGLDLEGNKDAAAKIERRRQKMEKRRAKRDLGGADDLDMDVKGKRDKGVMRYGNDTKSPLEDVSDDDVSFTSSDDDPVPESTGQIKVALFRVLASGEIKRGEYSPQFDAHDDDEEGQGGQGGGDEDIDHTTSFAKPKTLDPKSISTQTVTGIDPSDKPYAIFTFMYRGERQLQKMGILKDSKTQETPGSVKRRSQQLDFSNLGPLKSEGTVGFLNFRENIGGQKKNKKNKGVEDDDDMDSDDDEDDRILDQADEEEGKDEDHHLSPDDIRRQGELAEGLRQIKLKRQHSAASLAGSSRRDTASPKTTGATPTSNLSTTPPTTTATSAPAASGATEAQQPPNTLNGEFIGSPLKKQRPSVSQADESSFRRRMESGLSQQISDVLGSGDKGGGVAGESKPPIGPALNEPLQSPKTKLTNQMTGLDPATDQILQICCFITDANLHLLDNTGFETVIHAPQTALDGMSQWCIDTHGRTGLTARVQKSTVTPETAAAELLAYIQRYVPKPRTALLAGNSVHADKAFLACGPYKQVLEWLHYRIVDVSTIKEVVRRWGSKETLESVPAKKEVHEARKDILESIEEMKYYRGVLFGSQ
ncbi:oligoribonuclease [Aspergillus undulatus]|uniref:oligoribonuclease n=1 Tax=Aspergillus undulatus TaxID=1810928 RepID=UPI003CCE09EE